MLSALKTIERTIKSKGEVINDCFSDFVINRIKIQYYIVENKKDGEERFVIINTTGKSLTVSENIKPILLGNIEGLKYAKQWEERETWFWKNRYNEKEHIADNGVNDFLTWCFQIADKQEEIDIIKKAKILLKSQKNEEYLEKIQTHFETLKILLEYMKGTRLLFSDRIKLNTFKFKS